jgi:hypothetical protein
MTAASAKTTVALASLACDGVDVDAFACVRARVVRAGVVGDAARG